MAARPAAPAPLQGDVLRVMTFNLRVRTTSDDDNNWPNRRDMAAGMIRFHQADIVGVQEAFPDMLADLMQRLPGWQWCGDEGSPGGTINAVLWRKDRAAVIDFETVWLSPEKGERGWDAACVRTATIACMKDARGRPFLLANTHWDHVGSLARAESAQIMAAKLRDAPGPVIAIGDFNCEPGDSPLENLCEKGALRHARAISVWGHHGSVQSFTGFEPRMVGSEDIDHIFVRGCTVQQHGTLCDHFDGRLPSDHFPVLAEVLLP